MEYTKGEWKVEEVKEGSKSSFVHHTDEYQILNDNGIECIATMGTGWASGKAEANAQLISAAPELLEALKGYQSLHETINQLMSHPNDSQILGELDGKSDALGALVEQVLAKAKGK